MKRLSLLALAVGLFACSDQPLSTAPNAGLPRFDIADAARAYKKGFYWLPPMVSQPPVNGTFDAGLSPTVEICELAADACGPVIATYTTTTGPNGEYVRIQVEDEQYHVNWHTNEFDLSTTKIYRVSVRAGISGTLLGYADVQPVSSGSALKNVDTDEYIGLKDGRTLPIKFRIETGIVGSLTVEPVEAEAEPGATQRFVAILSDLHGNPISADVSWASSDEAVATVDQTGLARAIDDGVSTITATSERITGSAILTVEAGVVAPVGAGAFHSCVIGPNGKAYCWGLGTNGRLGNGSTATRLTPVAVAGGLTFASLATGTNHTCGITTTGQAYCWGAGGSGRLGNGSTTDQLTPAPVSGGLAFASISAGSEQTCGITTSGKAYCWGFGSNGELGNGSFSSTQSTPVAVSGDLAFASISVGGTNKPTCGTTTTGEAYCWGSGRLGNGSLASQSPPVAVSGGLVFASVSVGPGTLTTFSGFDHTCGITTTGQAYCWGYGMQGQLGNGTVSIRVTPVPVTGGLIFASISVGGFHACGLTITGQAYCWGTGAAVGAGGTSSEPWPVAVKGGLVFASISAGFLHTCGITTEDKVYCWGNGGNGRLGNGSTATQSTPVAVAPFPN